MQIEAIVDTLKDKYDTWDNFPPAKMAIVSKNIPTLKDRTNLLAQLDSIGIILEPNDKSRAKTFQVDEFCFLSSPKSL